VRTSNYFGGIIIAIVIILGIIISAVETIFSNILNILVLVAGLIFIFGMPSILNAIKNREGQKNKRFNISFQTANYCNKKIYKKRIIKPLVEKIELIYQKIIDICNKVGKLVEYVEMLREYETDNEIDNIIEKQDKVINYLCEYYDKYASLFLRLYLQIEISIFENIDFNKIEIKKYISTLTDDMDNEIQFIRKFSLCLKSENNEIDKSIEIINETIKKIKTNIIAIHSNKILSDISPIEDTHNILNDISNYSNIDGMMDNLDYQYERFIQEINISNDKF
jgi:hypothetical protein